MIEVTDLTKRYGNTLAVDALSFRVRPGSVTGFLGPNGAGKSTTIRMIVGLDAPTTGTATVGGRDYRTLPEPLRAVGTLLDAGAMHGGRRARDHLRWLAHSNGIPARRVGEVLDLTGLTAAAGRRAGEFSLGMRQRLGIAAALLGDPAVLILDEPVNGLDTEGIRWVRGLLRDLAAEGRTVFLSSHLMSEMEQTADRLIVIGRGRLLADTGMREFIERHSGERCRVRSPEQVRLGGLLAARGADVRPDTGGLRAGGLPAAEIGAIAAAHGIVLHELTPLLSSLEEVYTRMTETAVEYRGRAA
ncbi:ABC transporter ATP-binding protein [Actinomadura craniellae]|uniref:ABC transporter ATP-binding protein n=1 Tax=Actinomadura craniellae TaxID=2231787 RepID=A0A365H6B3_9ACTN|nr:ATP-binding cassette domain-containing protein [Actinomadura craniellae]RAY14589.1 ABC transporter ATP-binding protein [Actinomadura craniellae]